jgi:CRISPR/Cas system-associated exonuclease Cas4 (RecB family)
MTKLSRSKIDLFLQCPRCFWLDVKKGIKRPPPAPYTINNAIDYLLKQEFDLYREKGTPHPIMENHHIDAVPYKTPKIHEWRSNFTGVRHHHKSTDFLVFGAVDDIWINPKGELIVVDYKATGANQHKIYDSYKRQLEIYQWLLRQNEFKVSPTGYFVFARVSKAGGFGIPPSREASAFDKSTADKPEGKGAFLPFDLFVEAQEGDDLWLENALLGARKIFDSEKAPEPSAECEYCKYRNSAAAI